MPSAPTSSTFSLKSILDLIVYFPVVSYLMGFLEDFIIDVLKTGPVPTHVAFVMDGNRRYSKAKNLPLKDGHSAGAETLVSVLDVCFRLGVEHVTVYAFSIENFNRSSEEVDTLFGLLRDRLKQMSEHEESYARLNKVRVRIIGNKSYIPEDILRDLDKVEEITKQASTRRTLNVCFPYTSRDDITNSLKNIANKVATGEIASKEDITLEILRENNYFGPDVPLLDILIRTSGHTRLSDFMLWQANYNCTIEFVNTLWPDFKFFSITSLLLKWSYYKTLQLEERYIQGIKDDTDYTKRMELLKDLPPPPPFASVSER
ncbi:cis-prenyltransferase [Scheffersomyces xylosifermentans]|uniref:cis-prenyltransferase n=1 Tax=Scheffersomyces xylosifermentans TaxID=1304137 RepID=UPI00315DEF46